MLRLNWGKKLYENCSVFDKKDNKNKGKRRLQTKRQSLYKMIIKLYGIRDQDIPRGHYKGFSIDDSRWWSVQGNFWYFFIVVYTQRVPRSPFVYSTISLITQRDAFRKWWEKIQLRMVYRDLHIAQVIHESPFKWSIFLVIV